MNNKIPKFLFNSNFDCSRNSNPIYFNKSEQCLSHQANISEATTSLFCISNQINKILTLNTEIEVHDFNVFSSNIAKINKKIEIHNNRLTSHSFIVRAIISIFNFIFSLAGSHRFSFIQIISINNVKGTLVSNANKDRNQKPEEKIEPLIKEQEITVISKNENSVIVPLSTNNITFPKIRKKKKSTEDFNPLKIKIKGPETKTFTLPTELIVKIFFYLSEMDKYRSRYISNKWLNISRMPEFKLNPQYLHLYGKNCVGNISCSIVDNNHANMKYNIINLLSVVQMKAAAFIDPNFYVYPARTFTYYFTFVENGLIEYQKKSSFSVKFKIGFNSSNSEKKISFKVNILDKNINDTTYQYRIISMCDKYLKKSAIKLEKLSKGLTQKDLKQISVRQWQNPFIDL